MSAPKDQSHREHPASNPKCAVLIACASLLVSIACASNRPILYSPEALAHEATKRLSDLSDSDLPEAAAPYAVSAQAVERARKVIARLPPAERAAALGRALGDPDVFGLRYQLIGTTTAQETLTRGYGNCLSLTSVYVGLARELGLQAFYLEARDPIVGPDVGNDLAVTTDHIAALVRTPTGYVSLDFDGQLERFRALGAIDDLQAMARYYNNWGFELIEEANSKRADAPWQAIRDHFVAATRLDPAFAGAWNNLGIAESRLGRWAEARHSYRRAIEIDADLGAPYNNLGKVELERGEAAEAIELFRAAIQRQRHSPHARYNLALAQHRQGDDRAAAETLRALLRMDSEATGASALLEKIEPTAPATFSPSR